MNNETKDNLEWWKDVALAIGLFIMTIIVCFGIWTTKMPMAMYVAAGVQFVLDAALFYRLWKKIMNQNKK